MKKSDDIGLCMGFQKVDHREVIDDEMLLKLCGIVDGFEIKDTKFGFNEGFKFHKHLVHL